ncbi:MAG TPA: GntR family transcriptional regulator [Candidatus Flavonifractor merdipullorum]|uniref:GntR family transcriptional regulator n=1 Tax=Candidatus Flavonifractor merdipullorum TaxID=2838590 RepID=A0A9D1RT54_9FIRM|nr:GntR family transcriptional regulator [Candidatus Flavonifractor merdipullorum]
MHTPLGEGPLIYQQIAAMLEHDILRGVYQEEEQVPSTNELARLYRINPATAGKGLNLLAADGVLYKRRGLGMFVAPGAAERILEKRKAAFLDRYIRPMVREGRSLGLERETLMAMVASAMEEGEPL